MEPTTDSRRRRPEAQSEFPFEAGPDAREVPDPVATETNASVSPLQVSAAEAVTPVWLQRVWLIIYVVFCLELGMLLAVLPWTQVWTANSLVADLPTLRQFMRHNFVRGAVTGLGLLDIWLGVWEAVRYRERKKQ